MSPGKASFELSEGTCLVIGGAEWVVVSFWPHLGRVAIRPAGGGAEQAQTVGWLVNHPDCRASTSTMALPAASRGRQPAGLADLTGHQRELVQLRYAHVMEAETGYRSGSALHAVPGEPRHGYHPATTTLAARREAKVAEVRALAPDVAAAAGLAGLSVRTLQRWAGDCARFGVLGCADGRWLRRSTGRYTMTAQLREAIFWVREQTLHRSRVSMKTRERMIHQYARDTFGPGAVAVPSYQTLRAVWIEWFGPGGARQKYARSAARLEATGEHVVVHRPGQVVALDTTPLGVKVRETVFGEPVTVHLTLALDMFTHSLVAFRLTLVSDTSVDVAMLLRDVMMPLPLRRDWGQDMEWPYPGIPAAVVAEFAGHRVAGLPFFAPETVTTDHGSVYKNHHLAEVQLVIGANILPSRVLRPTDKQAVERAFSGIQSLLLEMLAGYRGIDVADRGADPEGDAVWTVTEMEHLIATWIVRVWQNRELGEYAPCWDPGTAHSPNTLFAAAMAQGGFALQIPSPQLYYQLLPVHHVATHGRRGVKIKGLWYDGPGLDAYRDGPSSRGGVHKGKWVIRSDPRDRRFCFFQDPLTHDWHELRWAGLPAAGEVPSFGDARVTQMLRQAKDAGLSPASDAELLPVLLDLIGGGHAPAGKAQRTVHAREVLRGQAAAADRPPAGEPGACCDRDSPQPGTASGAAPGWPERAAAATRAVDAERRRRREQVVAGPLEPPPRLGEQYRRGSLLTLPGPAGTDEQDAR